MARESLAAKKARAAQIEDRMYEHYGPGKSSLNYNNPFELTVSVVLAAQCTDEAVNKVTPTLFGKYPTPYELAGAKIAMVEDIIHPLGFFRAKAANIVALSQMLITDYDGVVPQDMKELQRLPGVGRKTANCVMCEAFKNPQGIAVDTHVYRIAHRLKLAQASDDTPDKTEAALLKIFDPSVWGFVNHQWVWFGREFCKARHPLCSECFIGDLCPTRGTWE